LYQLSPLNKQVNSCNVTLNISFQLYVPIKCELIVADNEAAPCCFIIRNYSHFIDTLSHNESAPWVWMNSSFPFSDADTILETMVMINAVEDQFTRAAGC